MAKFTSIALSIQLGKMIKLKSSNDDVKDTFSRLRMYWDKNIWVVFNPLFIRYFTVFAMCFLNKSLLRFPFITFVYLLFICILSQVLKTIYSYFCFVFVNNVCDCWHVYGFVYLGHYSITRCNIRGKTLSSIASDGLIFCPYYNLAGKT